MWLGFKTDNCKTSSEGVSFDTEKWDRHGILVLDSSTVATYWKCRNNLVYPSLHRMAPNPQHLRELRCNCAMHLSPLVCKSNSDDTSYFRKSRTERARYLKM